MSKRSANRALAARKLLPILDWLPAYRGDWLLPDALAGIALWAVMVPESMAYAGIVGVPPIMGLYTIVPALLAYALLGTSRQLVVGPDTATGLLSAITVGAIAAQGTAEFNALTSTLAVLIGILFFLFGVMRMGWVAAFIPTPVMRGFIEGLVYVTIIGQVPHLLGISGASGNARAALPTFRAGTHCVGEANEQIRSNMLAKRGAFRAVFYGVLTQAPLKSLAYQSAFQADDEGSIPFTRSNALNHLESYHLRNCAGSFQVRYLRCR